MVGKSFRCDYLYFKKKISNIQVNLCHAICIELKYLCQCSSQTQFTMMNLQKYCICVDPSRGGFRVWGGGKGGGFLFDHPWTYILLDIKNIIRNLYNYSKICWMTLWESPPEIKRARGQHYMSPCLVLWITCIMQVYFQNFT